MGFEEEKSRNYGSLASDPNHFCMPHAISAIKSLDCVEIWKGWTKSLAWIYICQNQIEISHKSIKKAKMLILVKPTFLLDQCYFLLTVMDSNLTFPRKWNGKYPLSAQQQLVYHFFPVADSLVVHCELFVCCNHWKLVFSAPTKLFVFSPRSPPRPAVTWNQYWGFKNIFPMAADRRSQQQ